MSEGYEIDPAHEFLLADVKLDHFSDVRSLRGTILADWSDVRHMFESATGSAFPMESDTGCLFEFIIIFHVVLERHASF